MQVFKFNKLYQWIRSDKDNSSHINKLTNKSLDLQASL